MVRIPPLATKWPGVHGCTVGFHKSDVRIRFPPRLPDEALWLLFFVLLREWQGMDEKDTEVVEEITISDAKIKKLRNLNYFKNYTDDQIIAWAKLRQKKEVPPENPSDIVGDLPSSPTKEETPVFDDEDIKKKFSSYLTRYRKEYGVDMNDANDVESLRSLARYMVQLELVDTLILNEQKKQNPTPAMLKGFGDFQRTLQQNINEIQTTLGISRKARKEKQVNDIPEYINMLNKKALDFWERKTVPIKCEKCRIELARYWLNFPDTLKSVKFDLVCDKCKEQVIYVE